MKRMITFILFCFIMLLTLACHSDEHDETNEMEKRNEAHHDIKRSKRTNNKHPVENEQIEQKKELELTLFEREPKEWGEYVTGVKTTFQTDEKESALTFDACGGKYGNEYDDDLIQFLKAEKVPATLFINERWIHANEELFLELANDPLFQI